MVPSDMLSHFGWTQTIILIHSFMWIWTLSNLAMQNKFEMAIRQVFLLVLQRLNI
uniref:Uncharacterized protein n=1 Tax=virus sp. ctkyY8 TaxID=2827995 RepID=A0A8S5REQ9_9VIRU|nr:MAG TPA: hypothetical protein [virus sp. ctkyY8]